MPDALMSSLVQYKATPFVSGYPGDWLTFYSPVDQVHAVLKMAYAAATKSLVIAMYGFDDEELAGIVRTKLESQTCYVSLTLDSSQAAGKHEAAILKAMDYPTNSIAIGRSEDHAIMHMKLAVVDGLYRVSGSTNLSAGGEGKQDNELSVVCDPYIAAEARTRIDFIHEAMLTAQKGGPSVSRSDSNQVRSVQRRRDAAASASTVSLGGNA